VLEQGQFLVEQQEQVQPILVLVAAEVDFQPLLVHLLTVAMAVQVSSSFVTHKLTQHQLW
jgi:hypothetical protein